MKHNEVRKRIWEYHTFGSSRCHEVLADLISREPIGVGKRVSRYLHKYHQGILDLSQINRLGPRNELAKMWRQRFNDIIVCDSPVVQTHYQNCLSVAYKKLIRNEPINYRQRHPKKIVKFDHNPWNEVLKMENHENK